MITIKSETPIKLESVCQVDSALAEKEKKVKPSVVKHVLKDLHINHLFEGPVSKAGVLVDHDIDIEKKIDELKKAHRDFLVWLDNYKIEEEKVDVQCTDAPANSLEKYTNIIKGIRNEAAEEGIGICAFIENNNQIVYTGFMSDVDLAERTLFLSITNEL